MADAQPRAQVLVALRVFGVPLPRLNSRGALLACDLFLSIGTSGSVYPAASFVELARRSGAHSVELNLEPSEGAYLFAKGLYGPATEIVPDFVATLLRRGRD